MQEIRIPRLLFEEVWFHKVFSYAKEANLDWLRMSALALALSDGDPRARTIDWNFIDNKLAIENPLFSNLYDKDGRPSEELIDRGTRWGLYQIHGQLAINNGFNGRLVNFIDLGTNIRMGCRIMADLLNKFDVDIAESKFGANHDLVNEKIIDLKLSINELLMISDEYDKDEEILNETSR